MKGIRKLAFQGFILLILVAIWQIFIAFSSLNMITNQNLELSRQINIRFQGVEQSIKVAPQEEITKAWSQSQSRDNLGLSALNPNPAGQRGIILKNVKEQKLQAYQNLQAQSSTAQFNLARDIIRIMLMAIIYAWAFYGIAKL
jgi:flagella basal body P-ring formation protein FlgA